MSDQKLESLWASLAKKFATSESTTGKASTRTVVLRDALAGDPIAAHLSTNGWAHATERDGRMHITCPFADEHTSQSAGTATTYFPANTGGYATGQFKCMHAHCADRSQSAFKDGVGYREDFFDVLTGETPETSTPIGRFDIVGLNEFTSQGYLEWLVKGVIPRAELAIVFGDSGSGKSFFVFDLLCHIARGVEWRERKTIQTPGLYIVAEGAAGFRNRVRAYSDFNGVDMSSIPIGVIGSAPNLMKVVDVKELLTSITAYGEVGIIVIDTMAASMPGGNENSSEDVGVILQHCKALHQATGALIVLIHHAGKDASKGARGWSGLRAAADCEITVMRNDNTRAAVISKMKDGDDTTNNTYGFELNVVKLGEDSDGDAITSCVCVPIDMAVSVARGKSIDTVQLLVMSVLTEMLDMDMQAYIPDLKSRVLDQLAIPDGVDHRKKKIDNAIATLIKDKHLVSDDGVLSYPVANNNDLF